MKVINVGSGRNMVKVNEWDIDGITIVGVNNVWKGTEKWDHLIYAGDYPEKNEIIKKDNQTLHTRTGNLSFKESYMKMANLPWKEARLFLGLPIYFTAAYWSLYHLNPKYLGFIGFDMNYQPNSKGHTSFYGKGLDFQLRGEPDYKYQIKTEYNNDNEIMKKLFNRLDERRGDCKLFNLSDDPNSLLPWEKISFEEFKKLE